MVSPSKTNHVTLRDFRRTEISGWYRGPIMTDHRVEIDAMCEPLEGACGDYIGVYQLGGQRLALVVADACGHGHDASDILDAVDPMEDEVNMHELSPSAILDSVSTAIIRQGRLQPGQFITAILMLLDCQSGIADIAIAGHPRPIVLRNGHSIEHDWDGGLPLGISAETGAVDHQLDLIKDDQLVMYTDGVTDSATVGGHWGDATKLLSEVARSNNPTRNLLSSLQGEHVKTWARDDTSAVFLRMV